MTAKLSWHCSADRVDRLTYIATNIGFGKVVLTRPWITRDGRIITRKLTDTGVILVTPLDNEDFIITAFLADKKQLEHMYQGKKIPSFMYQQVKKNKKHLAATR